MNKHWIGVASKDHVENGVKLGIFNFAMANHHLQTNENERVMPKDE